MKENPGAQRWIAGNTKLLIYYGKPAPYHVTQEIYVDFLVRDREPETQEMVDQMENKKRKGLSAQERPYVDLSLIHIFTFTVPEVFGHQMVEIHY